MIEDSAKLHSARCGDLLCQMTVPNDWAEHKNKGLAFQLTP